MAKKTNKAPEVPWTPADEQEAPTPTSNEVEDEPQVEAIPEPVIEEPVVLTEREQAARDKQAAIDAEVAAIQNPLTFAECKAIQKKRMPDRVTVTGRRRRIQH